MLTSGLTDVRLACRHLRKRPAFTCVAVGTPALGFATDGLAPLTLTMVAALSSAAALVACIVPARRAARVQPTDAMR